MIKRLHLATVFFIIASVGFLYGLFLMLRGGMLGVGIIIVAVGIGWVGKLLRRK